LIPEEIKRSLNSAYACYNSVPNPLSFRQLSKNVKLKIHKSTLLAVVLNGCETLSLILKDEHTLKILENRVLRRIF
jgi:hypothetical protein